MKTILVVDDEPDIRTILQTYLEAQGYRVVCAPDGIEAVELARRETPALILLDVMMPDMSGFQVARLLKSEAPTRQIPVVMLTARGRQSDRYWGMESGAAVYLSKPFNLGEILDHVRALIG